MKSILCTLVNYILQTCRSSVSRFSSETIFNETEQSERLTESWNEKNFDLTNAERSHRNRVWFWCRKRTEMMYSCLWTCFEEWPIPDFSAVRSHQQRHNVTRQRREKSFNFVEFWWCKVKRNEAIISLKIGMFLKKIRLKNKHISKKMGMFNQWGQQYQCKKNEKLSGIYFYSNEKPGDVACNDGSNRWMYPSNIYSNVCYFCTFPILNSVSI